MKGSARNNLTGRVISLQPQGVLVRVTLDCGFPLVSLITRASSQSLELKPGKWFGRLSRQLPCI